MPFCLRSVGCRVGYCAAALVGFIVAITVAAAAEPAVGAKRPNIVILLADDMGFSDPGCMGGEIDTPNLDRLAAGGIRFTQFYNTARCWPSRAAILTGYYAQQVRRDTVPGVPSGGAGVRPAWARLLPAMLKPLGYRTYHSGKWHVDGAVLAGGFDRSYCLNDHNRNFNPKQHTLDDKPLPPVTPGSGYYTTDAIAQYAIDFLGEHHAQHKDDPFFLYCCFTVPHFPVQAPPEEIALYKDRYRDGWDAMRQARYARMKQLGLVNCALSRLDPDIIPHWNLAEEKLKEQIGPGEVGHAVSWDGLTSEQKEFQPIKMAIHAAMVHRMDTQIGRVVEQLRAMGALDDTVIFFLSDNGASAEQIIRGDGHDKSAAPGAGGTFLSIGPGWSSACNTPFRLHKSWVHEGGITTPLIVQWPKGLPARGELRNNPSHLIDLAPTILDLAGGQMATTFDGKPLPLNPGKSLVPVFTKDGSVAHDFFWWYHEENRAVRVGDWKLVCAGKDAPWELYDLTTDRCEMNDLSKQQPDRVRQLEQVWQTHMDEYKAIAATDAPPPRKGRQKPPAD